MLNERTFFYKMLGYLFLLIALLSGAAKGYCGKRTSGYVSEYKDAVFTNFIRMFFCIIIGFVMVCVQGGVSQLSTSCSTLLITVLSGVTTSIFVVSWLISVRRGAYMMLDVFLMLGVIVPLVLSKIFFNEEIRVNQWIGLIILFVTVMIMCSYNNQIKEKMSISSFLLLVLCGVSSGLTDFSQKLFARTAPNETAAVFNFYTYIFSALVLLIFFIAAKLKDRDNASDSDCSSSALSVLRKVGVYVLIMSICLFANSFFKTLAAGILPSAKLYPLNQGAALILSTFMSRIFFKEKLTGRCIIGIILSFIGLLIINLL